MRLLTGRIPLMLMSAAAMYFLDPRSGRRRRAIARDRTASAASGAGTRLRKMGRMAMGELRGIQAMGGRIFSSDEPSDPTLVERVRSRLGRVCSNPRAVEVKAESGVVTLAGEIDENESDALLRTVQSVCGVRSVNNELTMRA